MNSLNAKPKNYWLMKSEPDVFSIANLQSKKKSLWDGVRNYMARNYMMKDMQLEDLVLFYHSNAKPSGVAGIAKVSGRATADPTQFDSKSEYFDPKSNLEKPRWFCVEVEYIAMLPRLVALEEIKAHKKLKSMVLLNNSRLSVQPVKKNEYDIILTLGGLKL